MEERVPLSLRLASDEWDQLWRLGEFRQRHPGVVIGAGEGWWQARIPEPNGEIVTTRYTLRALLDKLDELLSTNPGERSSFTELPDHSGCGCLEENLLEVPFQEFTPGPVGPAFR